MLNSLNVCCKQQIISTFSSSFFFHLDSSVFPLLSHLFLIYVYLSSSSFLSFTQSSTLLLVRNFQCLFGSRSHNGRGFRLRACVTHSGFVNPFFSFSTVLKWSVLIVSSINYHIHFYMSRLAINIFLILWKSHRGVGPRAGPRGCNINVSWFLTKDKVWRVYWELNTLGHSDLMSFFSSNADILEIESIYMYRILYAASYRQASSQSRVLIGNFEV